MSEFDRLLASKRLEIQVLTRKLQEKQDELNLLAKKKVTSQVSANRMMFEKHLMPKDMKPDEYFVVHNGIIKFRSMSSEEAAQYVLDVIKEPCYVHHNRSEPARIEEVKRAPWTSDRFDCSTPMNPRSCNSILP